MSETTALAKADDLPSQILEMIVAGGDLGRLSSAQQTQYLLALCKSLGLNPLTRPIEFIKLQGKTVPYAKRDCCDQLRKINGVSITIVNKEIVEGVLTITARASTKDGRQDEDIGSVTIGNLKGDALANATMKCITKAKRRVTLSIVGLGFLEESEIETIPGAQPVHVAEVPALPADGESFEAKCMRWTKEFSEAKTLDDIRKVSDEVRPFLESDRTLKKQFLAIRKEAEERISKGATAGIVKMVEKEFGAVLTKPGGPRVVTE